MTDAAFRPPLPPLTATALRDAFATFPSGRVAVAGQVDGQLTGIAASSFMPVSMAPPLVSVTVALGSRTWPTLRRAKEIGVSVLSHLHDDVARQLAGPRERRFDRLGTRTTPGGAVLLDRSVSSFACTLFEELPVGDHLIAVLAVQDLTVDSHRSPLVFHRSGFQRLHRDTLDPADLQGRVNGEPVQRVTAEGSKGNDDSAA